MSLYRFSPDELGMLWELAHRFQDVKNAHRIPDQRVAATYTGVEVHYLNLKAIHAAAALLGVNYDVRVLVAGRKEPPLYLEHEDTMVGVRVYARQVDLTLHKPFDTPLAVLGVPWASAVHEDPYVQSPAILKAGWRARDMQLAWCTRAMFDRRARDIIMPGRGRRVQLLWRDMNPNVARAAMLQPEVLLVQRSLFGGQ